MRARFLIETLACQNRGTMRVGAYSLSSLMDIIQGRMHIFYTFAMDALSHGKNNLLPYPWDPVANSLFQNQLDISMACLQYIVDNFR